MVTILPLYKAQDIIILYLTLSYITSQHIILFYLTLSYITSQDIILFDLTLSYITSHHCTSLLALTHLTSLLPNLPHPLATLLLTLTYLTSLPNLTLFYLTSPYLTLPYLMLSHLTSPHLTFPPLIPDSPLQSSEWYSSLRESLLGTPGRALLYPEVPRARHLGYSGVVINGGIQHNFFKDQILALTTDYTITQDYVRGSVNNTNTTATTSLLLFRHMFFIVLGFIFFINLFIYCT